MIIKVKTKHLFRPRREKKKKLPPHPPPQLRPNYIFQIDRTTLQARLVLHQGAAICGRKVRTNHFNSEPSGPGPNGLINQMRKHAITRPLWMASDIKSIKSIILGCRSLRVYRIQSVKSPTALLGCFQTPAWFSKTRTCWKTIAYLQHRTEKCQQTSFSKVPKPSHKNKHPKNQKNTIFIIDLISNTPLIKPL